MRIMPTNGELDSNRREFMPMFGYIGYILKCEQHLHVPSRIFHERNGLHFVCSGINYKPKWKWLRLSTIIFVVVSAK